MVGEFYMSFNNRANRCKFLGWVSGEIKKSELSPYAIEFTIAVERKPSPGKPVYKDFIPIYVSGGKQVQFCKENLRKGLTVECKGELRNFKEKQFKVCCDEILIKSN